MAKDTTRVQMELTEKSLQRLKKLKDKTESSSYAEVTKNAYRLYEKLIEQSEQGCTFCVKDKNGNIRELEIFMWSLLESISEILLSSFLQITPVD